MKDFFAFASEEKLQEIHTVDLGAASRHTHASQLLIWYAHPKRTDQTFAELGCGTGYVSFGLSSRYGLSGVGIDQEIRYRTAFLEGANKNGLLESLQFIRDDLTTLSQTIPKNGFDLVVFNPPHYEEGRGNGADDRFRAISREAHREVYHRFSRAVEYLLRPKGSFCCVINPVHLIEWMEALSKAHLTLKKIRFVHGVLHGKAQLVLMRGMTAAKKGFLDVEPPLILQRHMAGGGGLEPPLAESESAVLPIRRSPTKF